MAKPRDLDVSAHAVSQALAILAPLLKGSSRIERAAFELVFQAVDRLERYTKAQTADPMRQAFAGARAAGELVHHALHEAGQVTALSRSIESLALAVERTVEGSSLASVLALCDSVAALAAQDRELKAILATREAA